MGEVKFSGQVLPTVKKVIYGLEIKRVMRSKLVLGIADGWLSADGNVIYRASDLKVGLFRQDAPAARAGRLICADRQVYYRGMLNACARSDGRRHETASN